MLSEKFENFQPVVGIRPAKPGRMNDGHTLLRMRTGCRPVHASCDSMWADHNSQRSTMSTSDNSVYRACFEGQKNLALEFVNHDNANYVYPPVGDTPLHQACKQGWLDIVEMLIEKYGCDPNMTTKSDESLLHYACQCDTCDNIDVVKYLVNKYHLNPLMRDSINQLEPLDYAVNNNQYYITEYICQYCISSDKLLNPNRIKTTINLLRYIADPWAHSNDSENPILWKTADGDNILQLVGSSKICIACIPSAVVSEILNSHNANHIIPYFKPDLRTADDDTILEVVCQSRRVVSQISSAVMIKWSSESTDLMKIVTLDGITVDGNNFLELVCQSEKYLSQISSIVFLNHLRKIVLHSMTIAIPDCKTADGDTLLQLILRSEMSISRISSQMLAKLLSNSRKISINEMKSVNPNWTTVDGAHFPHILCRSNIENDKVIELLQYYILENSWNPDTFDSERNTVLHIACQTDKLVLVSYLIDQAQCNPNVENGMGSLPLDMTTSSEVINYLFEHDRISVRLKTIIEWLNNPLSIYDKIMLRILQSLVDNHKTVSITRSGSTLLHVVCTCSRSRDTKMLVEYLLTECQCDPNLFDSKGQMPLQLTSDLRIMKILIEHGAKVTMDVVFKVINIRIPQCGAVELLSLSLKKGIMLWHPTDLNGDDKTALDLAYSLNKPIIVNYLLTEARHDPNADNVLISLLELTTNLNVAKLLIEHGAKVTPALALRFEAMEDTPNKYSLIKLMLTTWNPDDTDSNGYTALHLACKAGNPDLVELLLSVAHCGPKVKNKNEELPIQLTTDLKIMKTLVEHGTQMTADVVFNLISKHNTDSRVSDLFKLLTRKGTIIIYPNDLNNITNDGYTALHLACKADNFTIVNFLLFVAHCDPNVNSKNEEVPIQLTSDLRIMKKLVEHGAQMTTDVVFKLISMDGTDFRVPELLKLSVTKGSMLWNPDDLNSDDYTALHLACKVNSFDIVDFLLSLVHYDPDVKSKNEELPIQLTSDLAIMKILVEHGAQMTTDVVFKLISMHSSDFRVLELLKLSIIKGSMLWNPNDLNSDGYTALHLACKISIFDIVDFLLSVAHCDPNVNSKNEEVPIQLTSDIRIMKKLVEHGAQMMIDVVFKLISMNSSDFRVPELLELSITKGSMLRNHNDMNSDGYTALHLACKDERFSIINYLLSVAHCDPNIKSKSEEVPLQMTTNSEIIKDLIRHGAKTSIMYKSYKKALGTNKPVQPPVKVFVVGNPSVGKSTLTAALKTEIGIIARYFSSGKVSGVDEKTVGIVPHDLESGHFGRVTLYDFAGHREFYSGHAALLQTAIQSTPPIFLLVVNISEDDNKIIKNILYWISFLENQCASVTCRPHIILIGSHADALKEVNPKDKVKSIFSTLDTKCFTNMEYIGFVAMNCQFHESTGMSDLRRLLIKSCQKLRIKEPITFNAHCFLVHLIDKFINVTAVTIKTVSETITNQQSKEGVLEFLPTNFDTLYKICLELNDRGHILLLKDRITVENSYVVIDKEFLLSKISGTVFAPEGFNQYKDLSSNTGVVPLSKIAHCFPNSDTNISIAFLTHLEFCHEVSDQALLQHITKDRSQALNSKERYYLFPGLISLEAESDVWETESHFNVHFGWTLQCTNLEQFLTSRFLQVLLLRLAFSLALESKRDCGDVLGIHRKCSIWKNGIFWGRGFGMETLVKIIEDKSVIVITRFQTSNLEKCLKHRSEVIRTVLECHSRFCPRVSVAESFIDASSPLRYPSAVNFDKTFCTVQALAESIVRNEPLVVLSCGKTVPAERFLSFEPYAEIELLTLQELWDESNENKIISDNYLLKFIQKATDGLSNLIKAVSGSSTSSTNENQLYQDLLRWRDSDKTNKKTYKDLRQAMDQYSIFAGRNVLVSIT